MRSQRVSPAVGLGLVACVLAGLVAVGWLAGLPEFTSLGTGASATQLDTSVCLLALGVAATIRNRTVTAVTSALVVLLTGAALVHYAFSVELGLYELVADGHAGTTVAPGPMAVPTALGLILLTGAFAVDPRAHPRWVDVSAGAVLAVDLWVVLAHLYRVPDLHTAVPLSGIAIPTTVALATLALSALASVRRGLLPWLLYGQDAGASLLRRLLPLPLIVLPAVGYLRLVGEERGWYGTGFGTAMTTTFSVIALVVMSVVGARAVARYDRRRLSALQHLHTLNGMLRDELQAGTVNLERERTVVSHLEDRGRLVADHNDRVLQRIFAAGMHITGAVRRDPDSEFAQRSPDLLTELNEAITELRGTIHVLNRPAAEQGRDAGQAAGGDDV